MQMKLFYRKDRTLHYTVNWWFRAVYLFFGTMLMIGAAGSSQETWFSWASFPVAVSLLLLAAGLYEERWIFDSDRRQIRQRNGLLFFFRRRIIPFDSVDHLELREFTKGKTEQSRMRKRFLKSYLRFSVVRVLEPAVDIEIIPKQRSGGKTEHAARAIARHCGFMLEESGEQADG